MSEWFRSWHGAPTDPKWLVIARRADVVPGIVVAVVWAMLDHASQACDRGSVEDFDVETYAAFSGFEESQITAIIKAMEDKGILEDGRFAQWEKRQPKREDGSAERARKWREAQKAEHSERNRTADIADTFADIPADIPADNVSGILLTEKAEQNQCERNRTQPNANEHRTEQRREEKTPPYNPPSQGDVSDSQASPKKRKKAKVAPDDPKFLALWHAYPQRKVNGKSADSRDRAFKAYQRLVGEGVNPDVLIEAAKRYAAQRAGQDPQFTAMCASWLNGGSWKPDDRDSLSRLPADEVWNSVPCKIWRSHVEAFSKGGGMFWPSNLGPQPGDYGCRAPPDLLKEFGFERVAA